MQTPEETLSLAAGSCRDTGVAAGADAAPPRARRTLRLRLPDPAQARRQGARRSLGTEHDFTDLHAWCEVYLPGAGWIGLDPTSGLLAGEGHIPLACTPEPTTAAPVSGLVEDCKVEFEHTMRVARIYEAPRVTKPYTDDAVAGTSKRSDRRSTPTCSRCDVRLTHGRRADLRFGRRPRRRRMEHRPRWARPSATARSICCCD